MKRLFKRAPSKDYVSDYEPSIGLIEQIAKDTREPYNTEHPALSANDVLLKLLAGETVKVINPFGTEVLWTLEEQSDAINPADVLAYIDEFAGQEIDAEEVRDFVQAMARLIAEGKTLADAEAAGYGDFVERLKERGQ